MKGARHLPNLDAVRGIAALLVFINHVEWMRVIHGLPNWNHLPFVYNSGMLGVNLFFVLSGFLITHLLLDEQGEHGAIDVSRFYLRRILRIWPLYFLLTLLAFFLLPRWLELPTLTAPLHHPAFGQQLTLFLFMLPNVAYVTLPLVPFASLLWSVGVEEQFYAVWPWLLRACGRYLPWALLGIAGAMPLLRAVTWHRYQVAPGADTLAWFHFIEFFRIQCLALGALAAWIAHHGPRRIFDLVLSPVAQWIALAIAVGVHCFSRDLFGPVHSEVMAAAHAVLILNLAINPRLLFSLQVRPLAYVGRVSYGYYLLHLPAIALVLPLLQRHLEGLGFTVALYALSAIVALGFASLSYFGFERFFLQLKKQLGPRPQPPAPVTPARGRWANLLLACALLAPALLWSALDETVWPWDPAWYGEVATDLWWLLVHHPAQWCAQMMSAFGTKAPGIAWLGQFFAPLGSAVGSIEFGLLVSVWVASLATLLLLGRIGCALWQEDKRGGWLAMVIIGAGSLFVGMSHQFMVEALQTMAVSYFYWLALCGGGRSRVSLTGHALLAGALALVAKVTSPLYCGIAVALVAARIWSASSWQGATKRARGGERLLLVAAFTVLAATVAWYAHNAETIREFVQLASRSEVALEYGRLPEFWAKWRFWIGAFSDAFFLPWAGVAVLMALAASIVRVISSRGAISRPDRWQIAVTAASALTVVVTLFTFTRQINEETRYLLPLAPSVVVLIVSLGGLVNRRFVFGAIMITLLAQAIVVHGAALRFWARPAAASVWLLPYEPDKTRKRDVMAVVKRTTDPQRFGRIHVNTYEVPWLNANSLAFYAAKHRLRVDGRDYYTSLGYAAMDLTAAWARVEAMQTASLIGVAPERQDSPPNFLNKIAIPALEQARTSATYMPLEFPNRSDILIYVRRP